MICFSKYQGAGNDFIVVDDREEMFQAGSYQIAQLCHRHYGIGADGLILLQHSLVADYRMRIFNADGAEAQMCGNGLRCLVAFLRDLDSTREPCAVEIQIEIQVETQVGTYACWTQGESVSVEMGVPRVIEEEGSLKIQGEEISFLSINSGVPHLVSFVDTLDLPDFLERARALRFHPHFSPLGVNINFVKVDPFGIFHIRTYERGVEGETLSCGTGAAAVCMAAWKRYGVKGKVQVRFYAQESLEFDLFVRDGELSKMVMKGPVKQVFSGSLRARCFA